MDEAPNSISNSSPIFDSNPTSNYSFTSNSSPDSIPNLKKSHIEIKFDITIKVCNRCRVLEQITCFEKKEIYM